MGKKRSLSRHSPHHDGFSDTEFLKTLAKLAQTSLAQKKFDDAMQSARRIAHHFEQNPPEGPWIDVYLASLVWQVRAAQGLECPRTSVVELILRYRHESARFGQAARVLQSHHIAAQVAIDAADWATALEELESVVDMPSMELAARATMWCHIAELRQKLCRFGESIEALRKADALLGKSEAPQDVARVDIARQLCELHAMTGDGAQSAFWFERARALASSFPNGVPEEIGVLLDVWAAREVLRHGDARRARAMISGILSSMSADIRPESRALVELDLASASWSAGDDDAARAILDQLDVGNARAVCMSTLMLRLQWGIACGESAEHLDARESSLNDVLDPDGDVLTTFARDLASAERWIETGRYADASELLFHIRERACFLELDPILGHAEAMLGTVFHVQGQNEKSAECLSRAIQIYRRHGDDIAASESSQTLDIVQHRVAHENAACRRAFETCVRGGHAEFVIRTGMPLLRRALEARDVESFDALAATLEYAIPREWTSYVRMRFEWMRAQRHVGESGAPYRARAQEIAVLRGYVLPENRQ